MTPQSLSAEYEEPEMAESAIGRLEVLGIPSENITKMASFGRVIVTAAVEDRLLEKAREIMEI
jgi:hypothetical protein